MSRENVERLVQAYGSFNEGDRTALLAFLSPGFVYRPRSELPGNEPVAGREQFEQVLRELSEVFAAARFEVEEVIDLEHHIVAVIHQTARGASSGLAIDQRVTHVLEVEDGRATALLVFTTREEALEALGLLR
jgi:ketosteroid isomerase-like protein